jgi:dodecin
MAESVYRVTELVGVSSESWEAAARNAVETAAKTLRSLRVAEAHRFDVTIEDGKVTNYRVRLDVSFKYEPSAWAEHLRIVAALLHIIRCVERMGDQCANIAKLVRLSGYEAPKDNDILDAIERMGQLARSQVSEAKEARRSAALDDSAADQTFVNIVNGNSGAVQVNGGEVSLNLAPIVADIATRLGLPDLSSPCEFCVRPWKRGARPYWRDWGPASPTGSTAPPIGARTSFTELHDPGCRLENRIHAPQCPDQIRDQNWRTVLPSVIVGGFTVVLTFSLTHSAARREDSSVPALSSQIVTVVPLSALRNAA